MLYRISMSSSILEAMRKLQEAYELSQRRVRSDFIIEKLGESKGIINLAILDYHKKMKQFDEDPDPLPALHQMTAISLLEKKNRMAPTGFVDHEHLSRLLDLEGINDHLPHSVRARMAVSDLDNITELLSQQQPFGGIMDGYGVDVVEPENEFEDIDYVEIPQNIQYEVEF